MCRYETINSREKARIRDVFDHADERPLGRTTKALFRSCAASARDAVALSVNFVTAQSTCDAPPTTYQGAAVAVATAAIKDGCAFASALSMVCIQNDTGMLLKSLQLVVSAVTPTGAAAAGSAVAEAYAGGM